MPHIECKQTTAALTADGGATGILTLTSTVGFYVGAEAFLISTDPTGKRCIIREIQDATHLTVLFIADDQGRDVNGNYAAPTRGFGLSNCIAFTLAKASKLSMPQQVVRVEYNNGPAAI